MPVDSLPYLLFTYDVPMDDGVLKLFVCVNLIDARCTGVGENENTAINHMEHLWDGLNPEACGSMSDDGDDDGGRSEVARFGDYD